jgi:hypothetical protein
MVLLVTLVLASDSVNRNCAVKKMTATGSTCRDSSGGTTKVKIMLLLLLLTLPSQVTWLKALQGVAHTYAVIHSVSQADCDKFYGCCYLENGSWSAALWE